VVSEEPLLPYGEVASRLRMRGQHHVGIRQIPLTSIIGSVDRTVDFDRMFRPRRIGMRERMRRVRGAFPDGVFPPVAVYEVGGWYFVVDGHHRVALAHELGMEWVDAEVVAIDISHALTPDVDVRQLVHTEQHRIFKEKTRLLAGHPEARIEFSRPTGYGLLLDLVRAHAYELSLGKGELVPMEDATAHWYETEFLPAVAAVHEADLPRTYRHQTKGDIYLWVQAKRRELLTTDRDASWADAARAARTEGMPRRVQRSLRRQRRSPLPRVGAARNLDARHDESGPPL
jgi:hypothetical protein